MTNQVWAVREEVTNPLNCRIPTVSSVRRIRVPNFRRNSQKYSFVRWSILLLIWGFGIVYTMFFCMRCLFLIVFVIIWCVYLAMKMPGCKTAPADK